MADRNASLPLRVPGRFARTISGIVVRDGRFYWSGWAMFWRLSLMLFAVKFAIRLAFALPQWRAERELLGIPGMSMPIAGQSAITTPILAGLWVLLAYRQRRRFNAAAPRANAPGHERVPADSPTTDGR